MRASWQKRAGFPLGAMHAAKEEWRWFGARRYVARMLDRMALLGTPAVLDLRLVAPGTVRATVSGTTRELVLPAPGDAPTVKDALSPFLVATNAMLREHTSRRFAIHSANEWFGCHVHLLPCDAPPFFGALELDARAIAALPRLPRLREIVPRSRLYESDFKCSARPSDIELLIEEIARFAGLDGIRIGLVESEHGFDAHVADGRRRGSAPIADEKYVDLRPVLPLLDAALARRDAPHRLYRCFADGFDQAIARATPAEAKELAKLGYLDDPAEKL